MAINGGIIGDVDVNTPRSVTVARDWVASDVLWTGFFVGGLYASDNYLDTSVGVRWWT